MDNNNLSYNQTNQGNGYYNQPYTAPPKNNFAIAALILGVCSLVLMCTGILSFPAGALGILFAILSRRKNKLEGPAITGLVLSLIGFGSSLFMAIMSTFLIVSSHTNENVANMLDNTFEATYGMDFDEFFESTTGVAFDDFMNSLGL